MLPFIVNDLRWSNAGDLSIGHTGDLADTSDQVLRSFVQEVKTRIRSNLKDWALNQEIGSNLENLVGEPNSRETAIWGQKLIITSLTQHGFCDARYIKCTYAPIGPHHLMYRLRIDLPDLSIDNIIEFNLLLQTDELTITFF